jgi:phenylacetate-coenzyme A ligase PaaK-like adenylate-forming protein
MHAKSSAMIPEIETKSTEAIKIFQEDKLKIALQYLLEKSPFYQRLFKSNTIAISDIKTLEDLTKIPSAPIFETFVAMTKNDQGFLFAIRLEKSIPKDGLFISST